MWHDAMEEGVWKWELKSKNVNFMESESEWEWDMLYIGAVMAHGQLFPVGWGL